MTRRTKRSSSGKRRRASSSINFVSSGERGRNNELKMHRKFVRFVFFSLGDKAYCPPYGKMEGILREYHTNYRPDIQTRVLRRWYTHFLMFGETQPETRRWNLKGWRPGELQRESLWTEDCTAALKTIVEEQPQLFLNEIRLAFLYVKDQLWSTSHLWEVLTVRIGWSLQFATVAAGQRDDAQRQQYMDALEA
jgi:hypothetical protein